jgi:hypothetical protein
VEKAQTVSASAMPTNMQSSASWRPMRSAKPPRKKRPAVLPMPMTPSKKTAGVRATP